MSWLKDQGVMEDYETFKKWHKKMTKSVEFIDSGIYSSDLERLVISDMGIGGIWGEGGKDPKLAYNYWREVLGE